MYKLLLVEDEQIIRKGLLAKMKHCNLGISTYYEAADGEQALELVRQHRPDIVVTDIHLIQMDGLSLMERIREQHPNTQFVVISGYPDFSYAKKAIQLGVVRYLVKPVGVEELKDAVTNCIELIEKQHYSQQERELLQLHKDTLESIHGINSLLFSDAHAAGMAPLYRGKSTQLFGQAQGFVLAAVCLTQWGVAQSIFNQEDIELIRYAMTNIIHDMDYPGSRVAFGNLENRMQTLILFAVEQPRMGLHGVQEYCTKLRGAVKACLQLDVTLLHSGLCDSIQPQLMEQLRTAANGIVLGAAGGLCGFGEGEAVAAIRKGDMRYLQSCLINHYIKQLPQALERFFQQSPGDASRRTVGYYASLFVEIAHMIRELREGASVHQLVAEELENAAKNVFELFPNAQSAEGFLKQHLLRVLEAGAMNMDLVRNADRIRLAQQYIDQHLDELIGVNELAELYGLNPNYFSTLFKKEIGETVIGYFTRMRIKRACQLLKTSEISVSDISKMIGYENVNYFYKLFKRHTGVTPMEYRERGEQ